ncbi:MAG: hypothetical protein JSW39_28925 [Desulfobacterales bacterium]|nr:MAG: hypothetical protein JSW39_28925 [Desulfobacterales bacterium]
MPNLTEFRLQSSSKVLGHRFTVIYRKQLVAEDPLSHKKISKVTLTNADPSTDRMIEYVIK